MKKQVCALAVAVLVLMSITSAQAGSVIWGNSASSGNVNLEAFDSATGLLIPGQQFLVPNLTARGDNGRGVAVLGDDIYYTTADSGNIYKTNVITHADLGIVVDTGFAGIANIATDGTVLYANDYQATNGVINKYTPAGVLVGSITLTGADAVGANSRDGFEVQNNPNILGGATTFIANRYDGGFGPTNGSVIGAYDVYDSTGVEIISGFITPNANGTRGATGIAYDGNHYFVSDIFNNRLLEYDGLGAFVRIIDLSANPNPPSGIRELEDLSAVGNTITNPGCGNNTVDPGEQCDGTADTACPGQCLPPGDPHECTCQSNDLCAMVVCAPLDQCHQAGTCDPQTGLCSNPAVDDGSPCDDGKFCTDGDTCAGGVCGGTQHDCSAAGDQCNDGVCNEGAGACEPQPKVGNPTCTDGDACTTNDTCQAGACVGGPAPNCDDGNECTADSCDHAIGCVNDKTARNGFACDDDNFCTQRDACLNGVCKGAMTQADSDGDGYCDFQEIQAGCNPNDSFEIPPQAVLWAGLPGEENVAANGLLTYASPAGSGRGRVHAGSDPSCATAGVCGPKAFCTAGKIKDPCTTDADCDEAANTCRVVVNYSSVPDLKLTDAKLNNASVAGFTPLTPGCSRKVDVTLNPSIRLANRLVLKATATVGGRQVRDKDRIRYVH